MGRKKSPMLEFTEYDNSKILHKQKKKASNLRNSRTAEIDRNVDLYIDLGKGAELRNQQVTGIIV